MPQVFEILQDNLGLITRIETASDELDLKRATDVTIHIVGGHVAVRVRRDNCKHRDWTIRSRSLHGGETEIAKLRRGFADWYLYGWCTYGALDEWMLIDLNKVRERGLLDRQWQERRNDDGTMFIAIPRSVLGDCIVASKIKRGA